MTKVCRTCEIEKALIDFPKSGLSHRADCTECYNEARRGEAYRDTVRDSSRQASAKYREANSDKCKARVLQCSQNSRRTPEGLLKAQEASRIYCNTQYATNQAYRDKQLNRAYERRAAPGTLTLAEWLATLDVFVSACAYCGETLEITKDHVIPLSLGGTNTVGNVVPACKRCNCSKQARPMEDWYKTCSYFSLERLKHIKDFVALNEQVERI